MTPLAFPGVEGHRHTTKSDPRVVGGTYWCGYWGEFYLVLDISEDNLGTRWYKVKWEKGNITVHATAWDHKRDWVITKGGPTLVES